MKGDNHSRLTIFIACLTVLGVVFFDRVSKVFFTSILTFGESIPVVRDIFHFTLVYNTGIAFGLFKNQGIVFIIIPVITAILIGFNIYYYRNSREVSRIYIVAFSLILGGAIGNLIDRIMFGHVIDFIDFRIWPVFNLADSAITIGALIILIKCIPSFVK
ncbi:MAG TPA: signal peptidase II [Candidatus Omnitrophota bacterium]|nr:signal peptidase II [Candidatus Omnitrophota bacterium]HPD84023.1 signal peptidase II [Candidatus Omnitrophota bacterium]HRZ02880.1 signal peptidase II [Candidatus Omnitrophota bacterium]